MAIGAEGGRVRARRTLRPGDPVFCSLSWADGLAGPDDVDDATRRIDTTVHSGGTGWTGPASLTIAGATRSNARRWRSRGSPTCPRARRWPPSPHRLPETPGGERNWDYRYSWLRDSTFTLQALHWLNLDGEADEYMQYVADLEVNEDGGLQIMYGIDGRRDCPSRRWPTSAGTPGRAPCVSATAPSTNARTTSSGGPDSILLHTRRSQRLPRRLWPLIQAQAECASAVWREPDQGIWEACGKPQHYVSSKLMCWVALDRAAKLAELRGAGDLEENWRATADEIRADIEKLGVSDRGCSASTTRPIPSTRRRCWRRSSASCRATTSVPTTPCWRSPTS